MHRAGPSRRSLLHFLLLSSAALAPAEGSCVPRALLSIDVAKLRTAAHRLFVVNGSVDTMAYSDMPSVDTIDRQLTIAFDLPELSLPADTVNALNETCGRSWRCGCLRYEVCPGITHDGDDARLCSRYQHEWWPAEPHGAHAQRVS